MVFSLQNYCCLYHDDDGPVNSEEEMVDADGDGIPLWGLETARTKSFTCFQPNHDHNILTLSDYTVYNCDLSEHTFCEHYQL